MVRALTSVLEQRGLLAPAKRGRPSIYTTDERKAALKEQQRCCRQRYNKRIKDAYEQLSLIVAAEAATEAVAKAETNIATQ
jgi:hypothetical protein